MPKRCLTLVETLIAIVLVLAIGALVFPSLMDSLDEQKFESAADGTNEQLMMARAHAQATGSPVEVTYSADKSQVQARLFMPAVPGLGAVGREAGRTSGKAAEPSAARPGAGEAARADSENAVIEESWARRSLGKNVRIVSRPPTGGAEPASDFTAESGLSPDDYETFEDFGKGQDIRLAVFMPDGSTLLGDKVWLNDDKGRVGVFTINPWSGMPIFKRLADAVAGRKESGDEAASAMPDGEVAPGESRNGAQAD